jgi:transglutaminase-like putative cysteine protease
MREYITIENIPEYAALGKKGDCGVQALLFITLCRITGIPARWQSGLYTTKYTAGSHDWAQFYIAPYGWLFADCSLGGNAYREKDELRREFYFGNLDPFRMPANREFQREFVLAKAHLRADPYDNQRGEVEYETRGLRYDEFTSEILVSAQEV